MSLLSPGWATTSISTPGQCKPARGHAGGRETEDDFEMGGRDWGLFLFGVVNAVAEKDHTSDTNLAPYEDV